MKATSFINIIVGVSIVFIAVLTMTTIFPMI